MPWQVADTVDGWAVDGSVVRTLANLAEAAYLTDKNGQTHCGWRFHTHFEIDRRVPVNMDVTTAYNGGPSEEKQQLRRRLEADRCYVMDRRFAEFALWNGIVRAQSSYVCRIRDNSNLSELVEERPLSNTAKQASVIGDAVIRLGWKNQRPDHPVERLTKVLAETGCERRPMALSASPPTSSTRRPKSLPTSTAIGGPSNCFSAFSNMSWDAGT